MHGSAAETPGNGTGKFRYCDLDGAGTPISHISWIYQLERTGSDDKSQAIGLINMESRYPVSTKTPALPMPVPITFDSPVMAELYKQDMMDSGGSDLHPENWMIGTLSVYGLADDRATPARMPMCRMRILHTPCPFCGRPLIPWYNIELSDGSRHKAYVHENCPAKNGETCLLVIDGS